MSGPYRLALIGLGKIAREQHLPAIAASGSFDLVATVDPQPSGSISLPNFGNIDQLAASGLAVDAVAVCTPPQVRSRVASTAIRNGWHVFLEKPPAATLAEVIALRDEAAAAGTTLFASWHSRHAAGVEPARRWLAERRIEQASITWREDVRRWHPGQDWIFEPGGLGVFDPGINALSIMTHLWPRALMVEAAEIEVPRNRATPIAARIGLRDALGTKVEMVLDFRQEGRQIWDIQVVTDAGELVLADGGSACSIDGQERPPASTHQHGEYVSLYNRYAEIISMGASDVDVSPLRLVSDAYLRARFMPVEDFHW